MAAMIVAIHGKALIDQRVGELLVAPDVLAQSVGDLNNATCLRISTPFQVGDGESIGAPEGQALGCYSSGRRVGMLRCHWSLSHANGTPLVMHARTLLLFLERKHEGAIDPLVGIAAQRLEIPRDRRVIATAQGT